MCKQHRHRRLAPSTLTFQTPPPWSAWHSAVRQSTGQRDHFDFLFYLPYSWMCSVFLATSLVSFRVTGVCRHQPVGSFRLLIGSQQRKWQKNKWDEWNCTDIKKTHWCDKQWWWSNRERREADAAVGSNPVWEKMKNGMNLFKIMTRSHIDSII